VALCRPGGGERGGDVIRTLLTLVEGVVAVAGHELAFKHDLRLGRAILMSAEGAEAWDGPELDC